MILKAKVDGEYANLNPVVKIGDKYVYPYKLCIKKNGEYKTIWPMFSMHEIHTFQCGQYIWHEGLQKYLAVGENTAIMQSDDAMTWDIRTACSYYDANEKYSWKYLPSKDAMIFYREAHARSIGIYNISTAAWSAMFLPGGYWIWSTDEVLYFPRINRWVVFAFYRATTWGNGCCILYSDDNGTTWTRQETNMVSDTISSAYSPDRQSYLVFSRYNGFASIAYSSYDGITWKQENLPTYKGAGLSCNCNLWYDKKRKIYCLQSTVDADGRLEVFCWEKNNGWETSLICTRESTDYISDYSRLNMIYMPTLDCYITFNCYPHDVHSPIPKYHGDILIAPAYLTKYTGDTLKWKQYNLPMPHLVGNIKTIYALKPGVKSFIMSYNYKKDNTNHVTEITCNFDSIKG